MDLQTFKKELRTCFVDFAGPVNPTKIRQLLCQNYKVIIDENAPDVVFYSVFGNRHLHFADVPRIFFTGENVVPDFNICDFAFGFTWITFEDRYYRCPNFVLYDELKQLSNKVNLTSEEVNEVINRKGFCNFVYSNADAAPYRDELFHRLGSIKRGDSSGAHLNNMNERLGGNTLGWSDDWDEATALKIKFQRNYRFTIAAENSSSPGYTTEKIIHALLSNTIPVYWGDPELGRVFNTRRVVNCHDYETIDAVVDRVREIDENPSLARAILSEPVFPSGIFPESLKIKNLAARLNSLVADTKDLGAKRNRHVWGRLYEERRLAEASALIEKNKGLTRRILRKFRMTT